MGQPREQFERMARLRRAHLGAVLPPKRGPLRGRFSLLAELHRPDARREIGEPDVVPVLRGEFALRHAARRAPDGADAQAFVLRPWSAETHDTDRHDDLAFSLMRTFVALQFAQLNLGS